MTIKHPNDCPCPTCVVRRETECFADILKIQAGGGQPPPDGLPLPKRRLSPDRTPAEDAAYFYGLAKEAARASLAAQGLSFTKGRKPGTVSTIRKAIAQILAKQPEMKNPVLWETIKHKPPRGWAAYETSTLGDYLEGPGRQGMKRKRFDEICGEERKKINEPKIRG